MVSGSCTIGLVAASLVHCLSSAVFLQGSDSLDTDGGRSEVARGRQIPGLHLPGFLPGKHEKRVVKKELSVLSGFIPILRSYYESRQGRQDFSALDKKIDEVAGVLGGINIDGDPFAAMFGPKPEPQAETFKSALKNLITNNDKLGIPVEALPLVNALDSFFRTGDTEGLSELLLQHQEFSFLPVQKDELDAALALASGGNSASLKQLLQRMYKPSFQQYLQANIDALFPPESKEALDSHGGLGKKSRRAAVASH